MAIPFYEDEAVPAAAAAAAHSQATDGDQVDGPAVFDAGYDQVDYEAPHTATPTTATTTTTTGSQANSPPSTEEQLLAWKLLALAMCKVLRQFYLQQKKQPTSKATKLTATVQIQPQAQ